jgi:RHS repeat-associated protein
MAQINPIRYRSYYYDNESGFYYLNSRYYDPNTGRFLNTDGIMGVNQDMSTYNLFAYCGNNPVVRYDVGGMKWEGIIYLSIHAINEFAIAIGIDTAAVGAHFLRMIPDDNGVYHALFDCWQKCMGYNILFDIVFDIGTSMKSALFTFFYENQGYTIWVWKGDYFNLGAGAEMGLYRGANGHRTVDRSLATYMGVGLAYNNKTIYEHYATHWWITGFNPDYRIVSADDLTACYLIRFRSHDMYLAFTESLNDKSGWTLYPNISTAVFVF